MWAGAFHPTGGLPVRHPLQSPDVDPVATESCTTSTQKVKGMLDRSSLQIGALVL